jgi:hypothetical protein
MEEKRAYETPELQDLGSVVDLTKLGRTNGVGDAFFAEGSVHPPPFRN